MGTGKLGGSWELLGGIWELLGEINPRYSQRLPENSQKIPSRLSCYALRISFPPVHQTSNAKRQ